MRRQSKLKRWVIGALVAGLFLAGVALAAPNGASIDWWVIGSGSGSETAGNTSLDSTIGQWAAGSDTAGSTQLVSGFWGWSVVSGEYKIMLPLVLRNG
ncbi:MAG: hypothetical protein JXA89_28470 [Anaerolineae bacterium]|nr:hypothetical protein [Anaerolineae bacterium]